MKIFAGGWIATKVFLYVTTIAAGVLAAADTLFGIEWMPRQEVAYAFGIIVGIEWLSRIVRRGVEGYRNRGHFFSLILHALFENVLSTVFYFGVASAAHLTTVLFLHEPSSVFFLAARLFKSSVLFGLSVMSITFVFVNLRGEEGARLFFRRLGILSQAPAKNLDLFVPPGEDSDAPQ